MKAVKSIQDYDVAVAIGDTMTRISICKVVVKHCRIRALNPTNGRLYRVALNDDGYSFDVRIPEKLDVLFKVNVRIVEVTPEFFAALEEYQQAII